MSSNSGPLVFDELTIQFGYNSDPPEGSGWHRVLPSSAGSVTEKIGNDYVPWVKQTNPDSGLIKLSTGFEKLGDVGLGWVAWRPIAPDGYRALSDLTLPNEVDPHDPERRDAFTVACLKESLVNGHQYIHPANVIKHEGNVAFYNLWRNVPPPQAITSNGTRLAPGGGCGIVYGTSEPYKAPVQYVLNLPLLRQASTNSTLPEMKSFDKPVGQTAWAEDYRVTVPCFAVNDKGRDLKWQVENSPTYTIRRKRAYALRKYLNNKSEKDQQTKASITAGVSESQTTSFRVTTGLSVSAEAGVSVLGTGGKVSATASIELGFEAAYNVTSMKSVTHEETLTVAPNHAGALYAQAYQLEVVRKDGTHAGDGTGLDFNAYGSYTVLQYPPAVAGGPAAVTFGEFASAPADQETTTAAMEK